MALKKNYNSYNDLEGNGDRPWSDDQGYLDTIAWLISKSHEASMDADQDVYDWFFILEQLQLEIIGQLMIRGLNEELDKLRELRVSTSNRLDEIYDKIGDRIGSLPPKDVSKLRRVVYPYHEYLNILIHKMDLRLHEVKIVDDNAPTWSVN